MAFSRSSMFSNSLLQSPPVNVPPWYFFRVQNLIDQSQAKVSGTVRVKLFKGNVIVEGRKSPNSLYSEDLSTFENDSGAYDQRDAEGFIKINSLRLKTRHK